MPEKGQPVDFSLLTAPGAAVVILSQLVAQELAQLAFSELTAPGAAVVISISQLVAQELAQLDFSELTAPGAASPQAPQQAASSWLWPLTAPGAVVLLLQPTKAVASESAAMVKSVRMCSTP